MSSMILRSFHIPVEMDYALETLSRERNLPKSLLVRHFIQSGMASNDILSRLPQHEQEQTNRETDQSARRSRGLRGRKGI